MQCAAYAMLVAGMNPCASPDAASMTKECICSILLLRVATMSTAVATVLLVVSGKVAAGVSDENEAAIGGMWPTFGFHAHNREHS